MKVTYVAAGLMSGTSMDGVDAALLRTDGIGVLEHLGFVSLNYDREFHLILKISEFAVRERKGDLTLDSQTMERYAKAYLLQRLNFDPAGAKKELDGISTWFSSRGVSGFPSLGDIVSQSTKHHLDALGLLKKSVGDSVKIDLVGYHGQTLYYDWKHKIVGIVGLPELLRDQARLTVIYNFRNNDVKHGGRGAPLAPIYHQALCRSSKIGAAIVVNVGGIANPTVVGAKDDELWAFDAGPGNALIDRLVRLKTNGAELYDQNGSHGMHGSVNDKALSALINHSLLMPDGKNFLDLPSPKALDSGDFKLVPEVESLNLQDGCRTLAAFSAECVVRGLRHTKLSHPLPSRLVVSGGGAKNKALLHELSTRSHSLGVTRIQTAEEVGWNSSAIEAELFAYLAVRSVKGLAITFPGTTGVDKPLSGGTSFPASA